MAFERETFSYSATLARQGEPVTALYFIIRYSLVNQYTSVTIIQIHTYSLNNYHSYDN